MVRKILYLTFSYLLMSSLGMSVGIDVFAQDQSQKLNEWFDSKYEESLQMSPIRLTMLGRKEQYDKIDDVSEAEEERQLAWHERSG